MTAAALPHAAAVVSACRSALGPARGLDALRVSDDARRRLECSGVRGYRDAGDEPLASLAGRAMRDTMSAASVEPSDIDAVVLCTSSYWHADELTPGSLSRMMCDAGLPRAHLVMSSVQGCHNAVTGLRHARNLLVAEGMAHVLVVTCDVARRGAARIAVGPSVLADGAASCLVSRDAGTDAAPAGWRIESLVQHDRHEMHAYGDSPHDEQLRSLDWLRGTARAAEQALERCGLRATDVDVAVTNNYNRPMAALLAGAVRVPLERHVPFVPDLGHVWSADTLLGLERLDDAPDLDRGTVALLVAAGPQYFGAAVLRRC